MLAAETVNAPLLAYNLTVEGFHTYFVAANEDAAPVWVHNDCLFGANADKKLRKHAREIYQAAAENGIIIARKDKVAMREYISGIVEQSFKRNSAPFEWNGIMVDGYVRGNSIILVTETGEFLTHLTLNQNVSSLLTNALGL